MITVKTILLQEKSGSENIASRTINFATERIATIISERAGNLKCDLHPDFINVITVIAKNESKPDIEHTQHCCMDFIEKFRKEFQTKN